MLTRAFSALLLVSSIYSSSSLATIGNTDLAPNFVNATAAPYSAPFTPSGVCTSGSGSDATTAINNALTDVGNAGGGTVWLPAGIYCVKGHISVPIGTALRGIFEAPPKNSSSTWVETKGTVLLAIETGTTPFINLSYGSTVKGLTVYYPNQIVPGPSDPSWTPTNYPPTIEGDAPDTDIENIMLVNPVWGIRLGSTSTTQSGRHTVRGIYGQPIGQGISVDVSNDVGRIEDVHFYYFWYGTGSTNADVLIRNYLQTNAFSLVFGDADWEIVNNVFSYGYHVGILFENGVKGLPTNGEFSNINFDSVGVGLDVFATQPYGVNFTNLNIANEPSGIGVLGNASSDLSTVKITNASFWGSPYQLIVWSENATGLISVSQAHFIASPSGGPAVYISGSGARAMIENSIFEKPTSGTYVALQATSSAGNVMVVGNMLNGNTVTPGAHTLQSGNQP